MSRKNEPETTDDLSAKTDMEADTERAEESRAVDPRILAGRSDVPFEPDEAPRRESRLGQYVGQVLSGNILTRAEVRKQYPYILFMALLMFLYISNIFHIQKLYRRHDRLDEQIKELRSRSLTFSSMRMMSTRQSEIIRELERRGIPLHESLTPPRIIDKP